MKKIIGLITAISILSGVLANAQNKSGLSPRVFFSDSAMMFINNNYIGNAKSTSRIKIMPYQIAAADSNFYFDVYGSDISVSIFRTLGIYKNGGFTASGTYQYSSKPGNDFNMPSLEYCVFKNGKALINWTSVLNAEKYIDTYISDYPKQN